ncbi:MAG TPA: carboxypeptidase regulatory-like domain-containing protein [Holophagaceae bacterium]|nr:carboxypeptidase regulatory-like domain-containing protein [Holophagaceae bacterium]
MTRIRTLIPAALLIAAGIPAHADTFARLTGHVNDLKGNPVAGAKVTITRTDKNISREVTTNKAGSWLIAGLEAGDYQISVTAPGYVTFKFKMKAPLGDMAKQDIQLPTLAENGGAPVVDATAGDGTVQAQAPKAQAPAEDPAAKADAEAREAFNNAIPMLKAGQKDAALPLLKESYEKLGTAIDTMQDESRKADSEAIYPQVARVYGMALVDAGKKDDAIPVLQKALDLTPGDKATAPMAKALVDIYTEKKDAENRAKYQAILDGLVGPNPGVEYNKAVDAFNTGKLAASKQHLTKAIAIDPKFPDSHYLMGLVLLNEGNLAAAKAQFKTYLELAPTGKHAKEIKDMGM